MSSWDKEIRPARLINEPGALMGLSLLDLGSGLGLFVIASFLLEPFRLDWLSMPITLFALTLLVPIRLSIRRKILRDALCYFLRKKHYRASE